MKVQYDIEYKHFATDIVPINNSALCYYFKSYQLFLVT